MPLPAAPAVFRGVSCRRFPLGGYADFLAPVACPAPAVELCLLGLRCLSCGTWGFHPCAVLCLRRLRFCAAGPTAAYPSGFLPFFCPRLPAHCCADGVGWAATLVFSVLYTGCLAEFHWVLHPVSGSSHGGCDCSWCGSMVMPCGFPCPWGYVGCSVVPSCGSQPLLGLCSAHCFVSLAFGWVPVWPAVSAAPVRCEVCSISCPS